MEGMENMARGLEQTGGTSGTWDAVVVLGIIILLLIIRRFGKNNSDDDLKYN